MPPRRGPGSRRARGRVSCSAWDRGCQRGPPWSLLMLSNPSSLPLCFWWFCHTTVPLATLPLIWASSLPVAWQGPPRPCWCCSSGVLSTPVLVEHPRDSSGLLGAVPGALAVGSTNPSTVLPGRSRPWDSRHLVKEPGIQLEISLEISSAQHPNSDVVLVAIEQEQGWDPQHQLVLVQG